MDDELERATAILVGYLTEHGPTPFEDLVEALRDEHPDLGDDEDDLIDLIDAINERTDAIHVCQGDDEVLVSTAAVLEGWTIGHRLTEAEVAAGVVGYTPNLQLAASAGFDVAFADGSPISFAAADEVPAELRPSGDSEGAVHLPAGWLTGRGPGDLVGFAMRDGAVALADGYMVPDDDRTRALAAAVAALYARDEADEPYATSFGIVLDLLADPPVPVGPIPPIDDLLAAAGLERRDGPWIGRAGSGWKTPDERAEERRLQAAVHRYGLDDHGRSDLVALLQADAALRAGGALPAGRELARLRHGLGHAEVTAAASELLLGHPLRPARVTELQRLFAALLEGADGAAAAGANVLLARAAEHDGAHRAMELYVDNALAADPQYWPALADAAWFAEDRGDAGRAISLLTETRVPAFADEIARLGRFHRSGDQKVGRNDPCPCGSGRKYKACCMNQGGFSLAERAGWVLAKAQGFLGRAPRVHVVEDLVFAAAGDEAGRLPDDARIIDDYPMAVDLALFEEGYLKAFLAERGHLLPADERAMAESWVGAELGVWRVVGPEGDAVVVERDGRSERIERPGGLADEVPGTAVLLRLLPVPDHGHRVLCATTIPPEAVARAEELLAGQASAGELARLVGLLGDIPPETVDDGDPLVLRAVSYVLPDDADLDALADRLDAELVDPDESGEWIEPADAARPEDVPLGSITLTEEVLLVRAASEPRAERLLAVVARVAPDAEVDHDQRRTRDDIVAELLRG